MHDFRWQLTSKHVFTDFWIGEVDFWTDEADERDWTDEDDDDAWTDDDANIWTHEDNDNDDEDVWMTTNVDDLIIWEFVSVWNSFSVLRCLIKLNLSSLSSKYIIITLYFRNFFYTLR